VKRGILCVETYARPGEVDAYHQWYDEVREQMVAWQRGNRSEPVGVDADRPGATRFFELRTTYP
jgi:hypothetical protein